MRWTQKYIDTLLDGSEYYDFELTTEQTPMLGDSSFDEDLVINIDVCSGFTSTVRWSGATIETFTLDFITTTGLDNYYVNVPDAYSGGTIDTSIVAQYTPGDYFEFHPVSGWSTNLSYEINNESNCLVKLNGGFYQGFFKLHEYPYEMMPSRVRKGWTVDMIVKYPDGNTNTGTTLNDVFPDNEGFIFYMGARAEDKYWNGFTTGDTGEVAVLSSWSGLTIDDKRYQQFFYPSTTGYAYTVITSLTGATTNMTPFGESPLYTFGDDFLTTGGTSYSGYYHYTNHLPYEGRDFNDNASPLYLKYPWKSITDNAFGIRIRPDGRIGYRVLRFGNICQTGTTITIENGVTGTTTPTYSWEENYSEYPIWDANNNGYINITVVYERYIELEGCELVYNDYRKGVLTIYVNARPVFRQENFEEIIPHALDRQKELQNGVPFNISWGGGTQGLYESVTFGGIDTPDRNLLLQTLFAGTWTGSLRQFKMYIRPLYAPQIIHNFELIKSQYGMLGDFGGRYINVPHSV